MTRSLFAPLPRCAAIAMLCLVLGCGGPGAAPIDDAGSIVLPDSGAPDAGSDPGHDGGTPVGCVGDASCDDGDPTTRNMCIDGVCQFQPLDCVNDWDCGDFDACTTDSCAGGTCLFTPIPDCSGCHSDAECDDGNPETEDVCDTFRRACSHFPLNPFCSSPADCDDGNPCTDDQCNSSGTCAWGSIGTCCFRDTDCSDFSDCTTDSCSADHVCSNTAIPGCGSGCFDGDGDGHLSQFCFPPGDDCDDLNSMVHPGATEICDNGVDDNCNGQTDGVDSACASSNTTCTGATALTLPAMAHATIVSPGTFTGTGCGASLFYTLSVTETSDLSVSLHFDDLPAPPPPCPGCPPMPPPMRQINYNVFVEATCGDPSSEVGAARAGGCYYWDPSGGFFGGTRDQTVELRRVPPGMYTVEIQAHDMFGWMPLAVPFDLSAHATPSASASCPGTALADGAVTHGTTMGGADAFGADCSGAVFASPEVVHTFTLASPKRVRLIATPAVAAGSWAPGMQLALRTACDPDTTPSVCVDTSGYDCQPSASLERILDPGTFTLVLETTNGAATDYDLSLLTEDIGAACAGAPVISASGSFSGTTSGGVDHFRWNDLCGGGAAPDTVYELVLSGPSRVVLDLVASYTTPGLRVISGCGQSTAAGSGTHVDRTFDAGTYQVIIDGGHAADAGSYVLNATILAM